MTNRITEQQVDEVLALDEKRTSGVWVFGHPCPGEAGIYPDGKVENGKLILHNPRGCALNRGPTYDEQFAIAAPTMAAIIRQDREDLRVMRDTLLVVQEVARRQGKSRIAKILNALKEAGHE